MSPRGGARNGTPGKAYPQRGDLRMVKPQPIPGGQYGEGVQQQQVINSTPEPTPIPTGPAPGSAGPLTRPTERPDEPMSAGAPWGPGANSVGGMPPPPEQQDMRQLMRQLPLLEQLANNSNASVQTRNLYRQVLQAYLTQGGE